MRDAPLFNLCRNILRNPHANAVRRLHFALAATIREVERIKFHLGKKNNDVTKCFVPIYRQKPKCWLSLKEIRMVS